MSKDVYDEWLTSFDDEDVDERASGSWLKRENDTKGRIIVKSVLISILLAAIFILLGFAMLVLCQNLHIYIPSGRGINFAVPYGLFFSYIICAIAAFVLIINKYLEHKFAYMGIPKYKKNKSKKHKKNKGKKFALKCTRIFFVIAGIPYTIIFVAFAVLCLTLFILTFMGYPLAGMAIMLLGVVLCFAVLFALVLKYVYYTDYFKKGAKR